MSFTTIAAIKPFGGEELGKVEEADVLAVISAFEGEIIGPDDIKALFVLEAEVYDPSVVGKHLALVLEEYTKEKKSIDIFNKDLKFLIGAQVLKGSITKGNFARMTTEGQKVISEAMKSFHIAARVTQTTKRTAVTLQRLAGAFPIMSVGFATNVGRQFVGARKSHLLPRQFFTQHMACLIPGDDSKVAAMMYEAVLAFSCDQTQVITKTATKDAADIYSRQEPFVKAMLMSQAVPEEKRVAALKDLGLKDTYDKVCACLTHNKVEVCSKADWEKYFS